MGKTWLNPGKLNAGLPITLIHSDELFWSQTVSATKHSPGQIHKCLNSLQAQS
jgi:hypothetical protein